MYERIRAGIELDQGAKRSDTTPMILINRPEAKPTKQCDGLERGRCASRRSLLEQMGE